MGVASILGSIINPLLIDRSVWAVKLADGRFLSERDMVRDPRYDHDLRHPGKRPFDWSLDLVGTGDILKIKELWLVCPPNKISPLGNTARLPIVEPGTAFQFKTANVDALGSWGRTVVSQVIGRVTNKETGECECFIWDNEIKAMGTYNTNIYKFGSWRDGVAPIGALALSVQGFKL